MGDNRKTCDCSLGIERRSLADIDPAAASLYSLANLRMQAILAARHRCGHAADLLWPDPSSLHCVPCLRPSAAPTPDNLMTLGIVRPWPGCSQGSSTPGSADLGMPANCQMYQNFSAERHVYGTVQRDGGGQFDSTSGNWARISSNTTGGPP